MNEPFYIGWEPKAAPKVGRLALTVVLVLAVAAVGLALALSAAQHTIGGSVFEWGKLRQFSGVLKLQPYPHLLVRRPGLPAGQPAFSTYYLVAPFKFGLNGSPLSALDGKDISLRGTLIYRGDQTMIEALPDSIEAGGRPSASRPVEEIVELGRQTFIGEIVDSKCYLGVMNPGQLTPHRGCAIRCISGGIPPVLLVQSSNAPAMYLLLVSAAGKPVNQQVLDLVAEPVQITGEVERQGQLLILRADPETYRRIGL